MAASSAKNAPQLLSTVSCVRSSSNQLQVSSSIRQTGACHLTWTRGSLLLSASSVGPKNPQPVGWVGAMSSPSANPVCSSRTSPAQVRGTANGASISLIRRILHSPSLLRNSFRKSELLGPTHAQHAQAQAHGGIEVAEQESERGTQTEHHCSSGSESRCEPHSEVGVGGHSGSCSLGGVWQCRGGFLNADDSASASGSGSAIGGAVQCRSAQGFLSRATGAVSSCPSMAPPALLATARAATWRLLLPLFLLLVALPSLFLPSPEPALAAAQGQLQTALAARGLESGAAEAAAAAVSQKAAPLLLRDILQNSIFMASLFAWAMAQSLKVVTHYWASRVWDWKMLFASGGMPSSHSSMCCALTASVAIRFGFSGPLFPIALAFTLIVMYDATSVRYHAGVQAQVLNVVVAEMLQGHPVSEQKLKEILGHTPLQVAGGATLGALVAFLYHRAWGFF